MNFYFFFKKKKQYGEILNPIIDDATPSIVINYKSRKEAEMAMLKGRTFQDRLLSITWVSGHHLHRGGSGGGNTGAALKVSSAMPGSEQLQPITDEEIDLEVCTYIDINFQKLLTFLFRQNSIFRMSQI